MYIHIYQPCIKQCCMSHAFCIGVYRICKKVLNGFFYFETASSFKKFQKKQSLPKKTFPQNIRLFTLNFQKETEISCCKFTLIAIGSIPADKTRTCIPSS